MSDNQNGATIPAANAPAPATGSPGVAPTQAVPAVPPNAAPPVAVPVAPTQAAAVVPAAATGSPVAPAPPVAVPPASAPAQAPAQAPIQTPAATGSPAAPTVGEPPLVSTARGPLPGEPPLADVSPSEREHLARSKRTGIVLVIVILLLVGALGGLVYFGYTIFTEGTSGDSGGIKPGATITPDVVEDPDAPEEVRIEKTSIPDLTGLFGLTVEEVKARLGADFQLTKTDSATEETNPAIQQLATFSYIPSVSGDETGAASSALLPTESIYASLDASGKVIDIYYVCDMQLLGYPEKSFDELLAGSETVTGILASAGVQPLSFNYTPPIPEESVVYDNPNSANRKVVKQAQIFSGRTSSDNLPTVWTLTITYDFGTGVTSTSDFSQATRMINLKLA